MSLQVRLLPYAIADGPHNMAADEVLLQAAVAGVASLRFYGWSQATVSLGYFQPARVRLDDPLLANLPFIRRPSGGATLVHHHELTYALALPAGRSWHTRESWLSRMHAIISAALSALGITTQSHATARQRHADGPLCFRQFATGDLLIGNHKLVGSAQRRHRGAIVQHGAILLAQSPYAPSLPGIAELCGKRLAPTAIQGAVVDALRSATGWQVSAGIWTDRTLATVEALVTQKYATDEWNCRR